MRDLPACCCGLLAVPIILVAAQPGYAQVSDFPTTAYSRSLNIEPEFVDETSLLFVFPQRAAITSTRCFALGNQSSQVPGAVGVLGNAGSFAGFLLAQDNRAVAGDQLFQGGGALAWNALRLGVAGRVSRGESENLYYDLRWDEFSGASTLVATSSSEERLIYQGAVGLGVGGEGAGADVNIEATRVDSHFEYAQAYLDTVGLRLDSDDTVSYGFSARFHVPVGEEAEVVALGGWTRIETNYVGLELSSSRLVAVEQPIDFEGWYAGLATTFSSTRLDWMALSAHWQRRQYPGGVQYLGVLSGNIADRGVVDFSVRERLWRELRASAGIGLAYEVTGYENIRRQFLELNYNRSRRSMLRGEFGWGVSYVWRQFDVRSAMRADFPAGSLFTSIDLLVHL